MCSLHQSHNQKLPSQEYTGGNNAQNRKMKLVMARTIRRKRLPPLPDMPLQNQFTALGNTEEGPVMSG